MRLHLHASYRSALASYQARQTSPDPLSAPIGNALYSVPTARFDPSPSRPREALRMPGSGFVLRMAELCAFGQVVMYQVAIVIPTPPPPGGCEDRHPLPRAPPEA